jgi:hypothetical protein
MDKALVSYEALVQIEPDHYWGVNNLANLGRHEETVAYIVRRAELRPNSPADSVKAAIALAVTAQDLDAAKPFAARARKLQHSSQAVNLHPNWIPWIDFLPAFEMWLMDDPTHTRSIVEDLESTIAAKTGKERESYIEYAGIYYLTFGMVSQAENLFQTHPDQWLRKNRLALVALARDDKKSAEESAEEHLKRSFALIDATTFRDRAQTSAILTVLLNRTGLGNEARLPCVQTVPRVG